MGSASAAPRRRHALRRRENLAAYLFLLPALGFFALFVLAPMGMGIVTSFFHYTMRTPVGPDSFAGLENYTALFRDPMFLRSLGNTALLVAVAVPAVCLFSLWAASLLYERRAGIRSLFRGVFYLPVVTGSVTVVVVWKWMFDYHRGLFNAALTGAGLINRNIDWLGNPHVALWCILLILFTTSVGQPIVLYVAALGNVDQSQVEAAQVDGASRLQTFWRIQWPAILPTTLYVLVITTINTFQCFALVQLLTSGGPNGATSTVMYYLYDAAFRTYRYGYANAMGVVLALLIAAVSFLQFRLLGKRVSY